MTHLSYNATSVLIDGFAVLITGKPKSGKSSLALSLIDEGAILISDDITFLQVKNQKLFALPPERLKAHLFIRGIGIIKLDESVSKPCEVKALICLDENEGTGVLPEYALISDIKVPVFNFKMYDFALTKKIKAVIRLLKKEWVLVESL